MSAHARAGALLARGAAGPAVRGRTRVRVHNVGSLGIERILKIFKKNVKNINYKNQVVLTYHPETSNKDFEYEININIL